MLPDTTLHAGFIVGALIYGLLSAYLLRVVYNGLRTGKIAHTDSRQMACRQKQPLLYWFLVVLFTLFAVMPLGLLLRP